MNALIAVFVIAGIIGFIVNAWKSDSTSFIGCIIAGPVIIFILCVLAYILKDPGFQAVILALILLGAAILLIKSLYRRIKKWLRPKATALWSEHDGLLWISRLDNTPSKEALEDDKRITKVWRFNEQSSEEIPWLNDESFPKHKVKRVIVSGEILPKSCDGWFENFSECLTFELPGCNLSECASTANMFSECSSATSIIFGAKPSAPLCSASSMFRRCSALESVDLSSFDFSECGAFDWMFCRCERLSSIGIDNADFSKGTDFHGMFWGCRSLSLDCRNWNVPSAKKAWWFSSEAQGVIKPEWPPACDCGK